MSALYLLILLTSLACMMLLDRRFRLFFWRDARRAGLVLGISVLFFVLWDAAGIALGIFLRGQNDISTGLMLGPEFPVEELVFLVFLCYLTMVMFNGMRLLLGRAESRRTGFTSTDFTSTGFTSTGSPSSASPSVAPPRRGMRERQGQR